MSQDLHACSLPLSGVPRMARRRLTLRGSPSQLMASSEVSLDLSPIPISRQFTVVLQKCLSFLICLAEAVTVSHLDFHGNSWYGYVSLNPVSGLYVHLNMQEPARQVLLNVIVVILQMKEKQGSERLSHFLVNAPTGWRQDRYLDTQTPPSHTFLNATEFPRSALVLILAAFPFLRMISSLFVKNYLKQHLFCPNFAGWKSVFLLGFHTCQPWPLSFCISVMGSHILESRNLNLINACMYNRGT